MKKNWIQKRFLLSVIFILITSLIGCAKENPVSKQESLFGWAGSLDNPQAKPFDYFYMKNRGHALSLRKSLKVKDNFFYKKLPFKRTNRNFFYLVLV